MSDVNIHTDYSSSKIDPNKFTKIDYIMLTRVWLLPKHYRRKLELNQLYLTTVENFIKRVKSEKYPDTYFDEYLLGGKRYRISYLFTSGTYLEDLSEDKPHERLTFYLRVNTSMKFYYCVVCIPHEKLTRDHLLNHGMIELKD